MRNPTGRRNVLRTLLFIAGYSLAFSAVANATTWADGDSSKNIVNLHAGANSSLMRQLEVATGVSSAPMTGTSPFLVPTANDASDEVFWDGFELCGDGVVDAPTEQCDRSDFGGATCLTYGFTNGALACNKTCQVDTSQCSGACPVSCTNNADCGVCGPCITFGSGGICEF